MKIPVFNFRKFSEFYIGAIHKDDKCYTLPFKSVIIICRQFVFY